MSVQTNPMKIQGPWKDGYVLDYHSKSSEFLGDDEYGRPRFKTLRTEVGELLYRFKYRGLRGNAVLLVDDLFRSGATLSAVAATLTKRGAVREVYAFCPTRTRSSS